MDFWAQTTIFRKVASIFSDRVGHNHGDFEVTQFSDSFLRPQVWYFYNFAFRCPLWCMLEPSFANPFADLEALSISQIAVCRSI
eukprot:Gb_19593 [translate_table: standard]